MPDYAGGSGQGLYKTPDDAPSEAQGAAVVQLAPAGLAKMQSPWNTPALLQAPTPQPADPASICKPPGDDCMLFVCQCGCSTGIQCSLPCILTQPSAGRMYAAISEIVHS